MYDQQITFLSSNQRRTHMVRLLCCFAVKKIKQHKSVSVLIVCHFFVVTVMTWCNDFISRLSLETKPRPKSWPTLSIVWLRLNSVHVSKDLVNLLSPFITALEQRWLEDKVKDCPNCSVLFCVEWTGASFYIYAWLLGTVCLRVNFCVFFCIFSCLVNTSLMGSTSANYCKWLP